MLGVYGHTPGNRFQNAVYAERLRIPVRVGLAKKNLDAVNANILGAVLNGFDTKSTEKKNGYYYSYNYSYENADR